MADIPVSATAVLPTPSPVCDGDTDAFDAVLTQAETGALECREHAAQAAASLSATRGTAAHALQTKLSHLQTSASLVERCAAAALRAVSSYVRDIAQVHVTAQSVEQEVVRQLTVLRTHAATIEDISVRRGIAVSDDWRVAPPLFMPPTAADADAPTTLTGGADTFNWTLASGAWAGAVAAIDEGCDRWRGLVQERETIERTLVNALARVSLVDLGEGASAPRSAMVRALTSLLSKETPWETPAVRRLLDGALTPAEVADLWKQIEASGADIAELIEKYSFELAARDGLPFSVRDQAGRAALDYALSGSTELAHAFARMGLAPSDMTLTEFRRDLQAVRDALATYAENEDGIELVVQLASLGSHDGSVTAAVSIGDLDSASEIGVFVPGMNSSVRGIGELSKGLQEIHSGSEGSAVVTWAGYRSPTVAEEPFQGRAERGSWPLADFLAGITAHRVGDPLDHFALIGHSYGTNVAAEALKHGNHKVDAFISLGSAGLKHGTKAGDLGVRDIHATHAAGDNIAPFGRGVHFRPTADGGVGYLPRVDPRQLDGANVFSSEKSANGKAVTMHNLVVPIHWGSAQWAADVLDGTARDLEVGYLDPSSTTVQQLIKLMRGRR
ncbi:hypothetical protein JOF28_002297 [Leucobacter exalbidus]|uniref:DUF1023 domain-containing protein n=1 Tax=Leucobacter exalbidus TaxID=662960 RepID=A0A940PVM5_9MICO|nr:alpha/beta hydrolase [Leucobacter exalbidus]MBP1327065.1 hypothetical protein [Leucobacter exalbidus]